MTEEEEKQEVEGDHVSAETVPPRSPEEDECSHDELKLYGLSKTLRVINGQTRLPARPEKVMLALRILLGLSLVEGNAVEMVTRTVPEALSYFLSSGRCLVHPELPELALQVLLSLAQHAENKHHLATTCIDFLYKVFSILDTPAAVPATPAGPHPPPPPPPQPSHTAVCEGSRGLSRMGVGC